MTLLVLFGVVLASFRAWRLLGKDDISQPFRDVVCRETSGTLRQYLRKLIECNWCSGTWIAVGSTALVHLFVYDFITGQVRNRVGLVALAAVAVAALVGWLGELDGKLSD